LANSFTAFSSKDEEYCWLLIIGFSIQVQIYKKKRFKTIFYSGHFHSDIFWYFCKKSSIEH